ncbi:MAG: gamma-glutamyl-gamma-aminobutyrate hydrolase family protein [Planctomycetes bacterium]|nr:gamma-glutamyl-gamma-aminobutyrate hydrolase family protein [Planctomycetota bacterium]
MALPVVAVSVELLDAPHYEGVKRCQLFHAYLDCLREAGLIPLLIAPDASADEINQILSGVDGILLTGGDDIDLSLDGGPDPLDECKPVPAVQQQSVRDMISVSEKRGIPLLGICLGMQAIGVTHGAELCQHLPQHQSHTKGVCHKITTSPGKLQDAVGAEPFEIMSYHHQGLVSVSAPLNVVATADDGTIEAIELTKHNYCVGVQWHPEKTPKSNASLALFSSFAIAAEQYRQQRIKQS